MSNSKYLRIAKDQIRETDNFDPDNLTSDQILELNKRYFGDIAAAEWENIWRKNLSTLKGEDPLVATLIATEWLIKGPEALAVLAGGQSEFISAEASIISMFSPETPKNDMQIAQEIGSRFSLWVSSGMILTSIRRATQHRIYSQDTPEAAENAFIFMKSVAVQIIALALSGATKEEIFARMQELASVV